MTSYPRKLLIFVENVLIKLGLRPLESSRYLVTSKWHLDFIVQLVRVLKPQKYLEIGIYRAGLINRLIPLIPEITAVDVDPESGKFIESSNNVEFVNLNSQEFWKTNPVNDYDLIFIDGNHSREVVLDDFHGALRSIKAEGVILFHDTYPLDKEATNPARCDTGYLAIEMLSHQTNEFEMMTIPVHPGLTLVRKRSRQVPWSDS